MFVVLFLMIGLGIVIFVFFIVLLDYLLKDWYESVVKKDS